MSCNISIIGECFEPDAFIQRSKLKYDKITHKGTPRFKNQPDSEIITYSYVSARITKAGFDEFNKQVEEVIEYLEEHYEKLKLIADTPGVEYAKLDFGIHYQFKFVQSHYWPPELIKLAGALGLSIEVSLYTPSDDEDDELVDV